MKRRTSRRKIITRLIAAVLILILGIAVEFVIHRYLSNRSAAFRAEGGVLQIYRARKWQNFAVKGISGDSVAAADLTKREYVQWLKKAAAADVNIIRVNTIRSAQFYRAFFEYNLLTNKPLFLIQGIISPAAVAPHNAFDEDLTSDFFEEIRHTIDVMHGKAVLNHVTYSFNIAPYVIGFVFGEDMDEDFVVSTNEINTHVIGFEGDYIYTANASPYEAWLAGVGNYLVSYEQLKYSGAPKLISWPERSDVDIERVQPTEKFDSGLIAWRDEWFRKTWEDT